MTMWWAWWGGGNVDFWSHRDSGLYASSFSTWSSSAGVLVLLGGIPGVDMDRPTVDDDWICGENGADVWHKVKLDMMNNASGVGGRQEADDSDWKVNVKVCCSAVTCRWW